MSSQVMSVEELYAEHYFKVLRWLTWKTGDRYLAEDLTSEVFIKASGSLGRFDGRNPGGWLRAIAYHTLVDHSRSAAAQRELSVGDIYSTAERVDPGSDPAVMTERAAERGELAARIAAVPAGELRRRLKAYCPPIWEELECEVSQLLGRPQPAAGGYAWCVPYLDLLTSRQREVMGLTVDGLSVSEIAARLGISQGAVRVARCKASAVIEAHLAEGFCLPGGPTACGSPGQAS